MIEIVISIEKKLNSFDLVLLSSFREMKNQGYAIILNKQKTKVKSGGHGFLEKTSN